MAPGRCARAWTCVLDFGLTLWVLRAIVVALLFGFAVLGLAPQAQDLLVDVAAGPWWYTILFLLAVFFVWAMPTHYAARLLVETDARYLLRVRRRQSPFLDALRKQIPRLLGLLPFVAMLIGVARSWSNVPTVDVSDIAALAQLSDITSRTKVSLLLLGGYLVLSAALFWWYVAIRKGLSDHPWIENLNAALSRPVAWVAAKLPRALSLGLHAPGLSNPTGSLGPVYLVLMFIACAFLPLMAPVVFAESFPRAIAVPFVLAGWTPLAAYASGVGRYLQVPIISIVLIGNALLTYALGDNYSVRLVDAVQHVSEVVKAQSGKSNDYALAGHEPPITERLKLHDAVRLWKRANNCQNDSTACPRPIIIAASGGASRAGFFTASVIGKLVDGGSIPSGDIRNRLFAISSVSGSSVGAVISVAALAASADQQPCREQDFWLLYEPKVTDWRSCLEALMSGDFLTPVFAGLVFRDTLRFLGGLGGAGSVVKWSDRASLIEQSWERHFHRSIKDQAAPSPHCLNNLDCPFLTLRPREMEGEVAWLPLLLLNGTSVSTGQRIVTSTIDPWYRASDCPRALDDGDPEKCPVLDHAYDFHWLISGRTQLSKDQKPSGLTDVRLSTAAHNSARFPLISPPGEVRDQANNVADRIVDGGFFENFGAQTALELAGAIRAVDDNLVPFILIISNDPEIPTDDVLKAPDDAEGAFLTDLSAPAKTILNTRAARGTLALDAVVTVLSDDLNEKCAPYAAHLRVWPEYEDAPAKQAAGRKPGDGRVRPLSFSWWLSKPVQLRLHLQTEFSDANSADNRAALRAVSAALAPKPAGCAGKGRLPVRKYEGVRPLLQRQRP